MFGHWVFSGVYDDYYYIVEVVLVSLALLKNFPLFYPWSILSILPLSLVVESADDSDYKSDYKTPVVTKFYYFGIFSKTVNHFGPQKS